MKLLIWKLVMKIICKWRRIAEENGLEEQEYDCALIQRKLCDYKIAMREKGLWN